ncbi:MAG: hypothetical protein WAU78_10470, partial [Roseiarcus sp.]
TGLGGGAAPGSGADANAWKAPDYLPEHLRDADVAKTFDKVAADWKAQRDRLAQAPQPPKTIDEYKLPAFSEKVTPYLAGDLAKDPVFAVAREAALKAGVPAAQFTGFVGGLYEAMAAGGLLPKPHDPAAERDTLVGERARLMTDAQKSDVIRPMLTPLISFLDGLKSQNAIDAAGYAQLGALLDTASGVRALTKLVELAGKGASPGLNPGGAPGEAGGQVSHADLKARQRDARNDPNSMSFDAAYRAETTRLYQQAFG